MVVFRPDSPASPISTPQSAKSPAGPEAKMSSYILFIILKILQDFNKNLVC